MNVQDRQAVLDAIAYAPEDIRNAARLAYHRLWGEEYEAIVRGERGFVVNGLDAKQLVQHLSRMGSGEVRKVMEAACEFYGFELHCDEDVQFRLNAKSTVFCPEIWTWDEAGLVTMERRALSEWPQWAQDERERLCGKPKPKCNNCTCTQCRPIPAPNSQLLQHVIDRGDCK